MCIWPGTKSSGHREKSMSRDSKTRRDARKKKEAKRPIRRLGAALQPHAQLETTDGNTVGGAGWRDGEWLTVLGGQVVARTPSAALTLAMLRHVVAVQEQAGTELKLTFSPTLEHAATREAQAEGRSLEEYLHVLEQERLERLEQDQPPERDASPETRH